MNIYDIAPKSLWDEMLDQKMVSIQTHPQLPLFIYNYTQSAQFSKTWNAATLASRGLIADADGSIVARPFSKFFNYGEVDPSAISELTGRVISSDKLDGSMGVGYVNPKTGKINIATRGSFASDQALHATELYLNRYDGKWEPRADSTYIWEIIYPENRIVIDYGSRDELVLIGRINTETGKSTPLPEIDEWPFDRAEVFDHATLEDSLKAAPRKNAEGIVVHFTESDVRVKIKQEDYVRLHRIVTGVTARRVWDVLASDDDLEEWLAEMPEEFAVFIRETADGLQDQHDEILRDLEDKYSKIVTDLPEGFTQKDFALAVKTNATGKMQGLLFQRHKGITPSIWPMIRPEHIPLTNWG